MQSIRKNDCLLKVIEIFIIVVLKGDVYKNIFCISYEKDANTYTN